MVEHEQKKDGKIKMYVNLMGGPLDGKRILTNDPPNEIKLSLYVFKNRQMSKVFSDSVKTWYYERKLPSKNYCPAPKAIGVAVYRYNFRIKEEKGKIVEKYYDYIRSEKISKEVEENKEAEE